MKIYVQIKPNSSTKATIAKVEIPAERFGLFANKERFISGFKVSVNAGPVDGQANKELIGIIAKHFNVAKSKVSIVQGLKGRYKVLMISE